MRRNLLLCIATLALCGCATSSPQITHLQLASGKRQITEHDSPVIALDAVAMPDYLLRRDLLRRESDFKLHYDNTRRWAEPLDLAIQRVLEQRLESLLNTGQIYAFPEPPPGSPDWLLRVSVAHFEARGDTVFISAEGRWEKPGKALRQVEQRVEKILFEDSITLSNDSGEDIAAAMSELLRRFSANLAAILMPIDRAQASPTITGTSEK